MAVRSDWSRHAVWGALKSGPYINNPDNGEEYFDKGSLSVVNGDRPLLVNANGTLLRNTPGTGDGDPFWQKIYDDVLGDSRRRDIFNVFYPGDIIKNVLAVSFALALHKAFPDLLLRRVRTADARP